MFAYANGNPVMMIDPDGRLAISVPIWFAIAMGIVAAMFTTFMVIHLSWGFSGLFENGTWLGIGRLLLALAGGLAVGAVVGFVIYTWLAQAIVFVVSGLIIARDWIVGLFRRPTSSWTIEQERARNRVLRAAVIAITGSEMEGIATPTARQNAWSAANNAGRRTILTNLLAELQGIMGTSLDPQITWRTSGSLGLFHHDHSWRGSGYSARLSFNESILNYAEAVRAFRIISHEVRHAYQFESGLQPGTHRVSQQTSEVWRRNHNAPVPQGTFAHGFPSPAHMRSPIEFDAYFFTGQITIARFNQWYGAPLYYYGWSATWPFTLS